METQSFRRSVKLSEHLAMVNSSNLQDLLKFQNDDNSGHSRRQSADNSVTLSSIRTANNCNSNAGRTLLDIMQNEQENSSNSIQLNFQASENSQETSVNIERSNFGSSGDVPVSPQARMSLMELLEQTDRQWNVEENTISLQSVARIMVGEEEERTDGGAALVYVCCVCMVRHKGAAFIPCGHTFCRLCSRELWINRGNCPLCNDYILEILDIF